MPHNPNSPQGVHPHATLLARNIPRLGRFLTGAVIFPRKEIKWQASPNPARSRAPVAETPGEIVEMTPEQGKAIAIYSARKIIEFRECMRREFMRPDSFIHIPRNPLWFWQEF